MKPQQNLSKTKSDFNDKVLAKKKKISHLQQNLCVRDL